MQNATPVKVQPPPDRVKSYRQKAIFMVSIPEERLVKCLEDDCRVYYDELAQACPKCGSRAALPIRRSAA